MSKPKKSFKMKKLKLLMLVMTMALFIGTSCTNNEPVSQDQQNIEESASITTALNELSTQFNAEGNLMVGNNPAGNIVLDFCFDFVYPLTLSYNNGSTVTVESLDDLVTVIISSTDTLFVNGIAFPFNVETYDDSSNSIEIETIEDEDDFIDLLESCDFNDADNCVCTEEYDPVCVAIMSPDGEMFTVTYPNSCFAECDGFTDEDYLDDCQDDYYSTGFECFEFNFPISVVTEDGETITINSLEDLETALYDVYIFDFVYPFTVTVFDEDGEEVETIDDADDFEDILEDCFNDFGDCFLTVQDVQDALLSCDEFEIELEDTEGDTENVYQVNFEDGNEIIVNGEPTVTETGTWSVTNVNGEPVLTISGLQTFSSLNGSWVLDDCDFDSLEFENGTFGIDLECNGGDSSGDDCDQCEAEPFEPVCVEYTDEDGDEVFEVYPNACYALCQGFTEDDFVNCDDGNNSGNCSEEAITNSLIQCEWYVASSVLNTTDDVTLDFDVDGSIDIEIGDMELTGTWDIASTPSTNDVFLFFNLPAPLDMVSALDWTVAECSEGYILLQSNNDFLALERDCD